MHIARILNRCLLFALLVTAYPLTAAFGQQSIVDQFEFRSQTREGFTMPYRLFVPDDYDAAQSYPLVLALHGAGERGTDNIRQVTPHRMATSWADPANQAVNPAFVVAPQVPPGGRWTMDRPVSESSFNSEQLTTLAILDSLEQEFNIDPNRIYITGLSMGGHGTWDFISRLPNRFAAAIPMSGKTYAEQAESIINLPIWAFHGESDTVVLASGSRGIVHEMENLGRNVIYPECRRAPPQSKNFDCPGTIPLDSLESAIDAHADLIYSARRLGGHGPWNVWYDHPLLAGWLFSKYRLDSEAISIGSPEPGMSWGGTNKVWWSYRNAATDADSVEVWISLDNKQSWEVVDRTLLGAGEYDLDTSAYPDTPFAYIRLIIKNQDGFVYSRETSGPFLIGNTGMAAPYLSVDDEFLRFDPDVVDETITFDLLAADVEDDPLQAALFYSIDNGITYSMFDTIDLLSSLETQTITVDIAALPNAGEARIRFDLSDGTSISSSVTPAFTKRTPRTVNPNVVQVAGEGIGEVTMHFINSDQLTGHNYQITIDSSDPSAKTYSVVDLQTNMQVLNAVPFSDGIQESPLFDGMRLIVQDPEAGRANLEETGWITGDTNLGVSISGGEVRIAVLFVTLLDTEDDYEITISDSVADTSIAMYARPARELFFSVTARSDGQKRKVVFDDDNADGQLGDDDILYILEPNADGELVPAWDLAFSTSDSTVLPEPGDTFLFVPHRKLSSADVFAFTAALGVAMEDETTQDAAGLLSAYPNPFLDHATIQYRLRHPALVTIEIYDLLGRRVAMLLHDQQTPGNHEIQWYGTDSNGNRIASGVHVVSMTLTSSQDNQTRQWHQSIVVIR